MCRKSLCEPPDVCPRPPDVDLAVRPEEFEVDELGGSASRGLASLRL